MSHGKNLKINKAALSVSTAFLMVSSVVNLGTSAAQTNKFTVTADKTQANAGDKINVTVGFTPDNEGAAGFTISLHYDPTKVAVYVPTDEEAENEFAADSRFSVITNYSAGEGTVKIVGADLKGANVTKETPVALAEFTVLDGAEGDIDYWIEVETVVTADDEGYYAASYTAPTYNSPYVVDGPENAAVSEPQEAPEEKPEAAEPEVTEPEEVTAPEKDEPEYVPEPDIPEYVEVPDDTPEAPEEEVAVEEPAEEEPEYTPEPVETEEEPEYAETEESAEPLFSYTQGENDFQSETALQYEFRLSDYIDNYYQNYNINVYFTTTGNLSGAIGLMNNGSWVSQPNRTTDLTEDCWTFENVDPIAASDSVFMQIYYMKANAQLDITKVEIVPVNGADTDDEAEVNYESPEDFESDTPAEDNELAYNEQPEYIEVGGSEEESPADTEVSDTDPTEDTAAQTEQSGEAQPAEDTAAENTDSQPAPDAAPAEEEAQPDEAAPTAEQPTEQTPAPVTAAPAAPSAPAAAAAEKPAEVKAAADSTPTKEEAVTEAVNKAAENAEKSGASSVNPNTGKSTGKRVMDLLSLAAAAVVAYSLAAVIFNKLRKN